MQYNEKKLNRQKLSFSRWIANLAISFARAGIIEAGTGFGKTFILIMTILDMNNRHPERTSIVIVPTTKLKDDWTRTKQVFNEAGELVEDFGHIIKHKLQNVRVFVINTYVTYQEWECDLLGIDEIHRVAGKDAVLFSTVIKRTKYRFGMGLTATLDEAQREFLAELGWNIVDTISEEECEREGYTSSSIVYNLGIPLSEEDKKYNDKVNEDFKYYFSKFDHEFELVKACNARDNTYVFVKTREGTNLGRQTGKEWRLWLARKKNWNGDPDHSYSPQNISKYAAQGMSIMSKRKDKWQNMPSKLRYVKAIVDIFPNTKTIVFSETSDFADKVVELFPEKCLAYHTNLITLAIRGTEIVKEPTKEQSKVLRKEGFQIKGVTIRKREAIQQFQDFNSNYWVISAVRALDEGTDVKTIKLVIQCAYSSKSRQDTQRNGRGKRIDYDDLAKTTIIINLYMKGTQEEKWLKSKQMGKRMIREISDVSEITTKKVKLWMD